MQTSEEINGQVEKKQSAEATTYTPGFYSAWAALQSAASAVWSVMPSVWSTSAAPAIDQSPSSVIDVINAVTTLNWAPVKNWSFVSGKEARLFSHDRAKMIVLNSENIAIISEVILNAALAKVTRRDVKDEFACLLSSSLNSILIFSHAQDAKREDKICDDVKAKVLELSKKLASDWNVIENKDFPKKTSESSLVIMRKESGDFDGEKFVLKVLVQDLKTKKLIDNIDVYTFNNDENVYLTAKSKVDLDMLLSHIEPILAGVEKPRAKMEAAR